MYCNNIFRNLRVRSRKKKKQSSTMEACYNIFRILTIFKVVLSGGPIIRKKKKREIESIVYVLHINHLIVSMFPCFQRERERYAADNRCRVVGLMVSPKI